MAGVLESLRGQLIVSCQPVKDGALDRPEFVAGFAAAAINAGAAGLRIEGLLNMRAARATTAAPIIGLVKRSMPSSPVFITPEPEDVRALADCGADVVAFDATLRARPARIEDLVASIHAAGKLAMADVANLADAVAAAAAGADLIGTTLSGYVGGATPLGPDNDLVAQCVGLGVPILAEGRYRTPDQARLAIEAGAHAVVVGSAITRPEHLTTWFRDAIRAARPRRTRAPTLAVDLGGTKTLVALVAGAEIVARRSIATQKERGPHAWLDAIAEAASDWRGRFATAALAVTGLVNGGRWTSLNPAVLPIPARFPLVEEVSRRLGVNVIAMNDAQAAAWGEYRLGAGRGRDMVFVTISTGVGGGVVLGGRLITGRAGLAGHIGQMRIPGDGGDKRLEELASGSALEREAARLGHNANGAAVMKAACAGEPWADQIAERAAGRLAAALASIQMMLDPDCFVVGGGLGLAAGYLDRVRRRLASIDESMRPEVRPAALRANAGLLGVADYSQTQQFNAEDQ